MSRHGRVRLAALALVAVVAACDRGPSGPGSITAVASGPALGGVVLEVQGAGIRAFSARASTRLYSATVERRAGAHRVVLITPEPGELSFDLEVDDVGMEGPVITVVTAANADNQVIAASNVTVRLER